MIYYLIFNVATAITARIIPISQNRETILGSVIGISGF